MQVTSVGHAGFRIETRAGSILCDPWVNPAYFASWFPFPDNSQLDWDALGDCDYLYVSHLHKDHFDPENLVAHVNKDAVVLLPDYPVPDLRRELEKLGFHRFFETTDSVKHTVSGPKGDLEVMIIALRAPADGPIGDSGLVVSDGVTTAFNIPKQIAIRSMAAQEKAINQRVDASKFQNDHFVDQIAQRYLIQGLTMGGVKD